MRRKRKQPSYNQALAGLVPSAISGLVEQRATIERLEARVAELEAENERLRKRNEWKPWGTA